MSVLIGHASIDENGKAQGGMGGDQTKKEVCKRNWYKASWDVVLRCTDPSIAEKMAIACEQGCDNNNIGYDQKQRNTLYTEAKKVNYDLSKINTKCECDCSSFMCVCAIAAGLSESYFYSGNMRTTSNMRAAFEKTGKFEILTDSKYLNSDSYLKRGDILVNEGSHTIMVLSNGANYDQKNKEVSGIMEFKKGGSTYLSKNFRQKEFDCHGNGCCSNTVLDSKLVEYLQKIRDHFGKAVNITSAYRCTTHNKKIGGATKSYHIQGKAADIVVQGVTPREVAKYAESIGILGIGLYETSKDGYFTHIDTRTTKFFWYGQKEEPRTTFKDSSTSNSTSNTPTTSKPNQNEYHKSKSKYTVKLTYLQYGDKGKDVQILQELLIIRGYNIKASGEFDASTKSAVIDFQNKTGQTADGVVGSKTMEKLLTV